MENAVINIARCYKKIDKAVALNLHCFSQRRFSSLRCSIENRHKPTVNIVNVRNMTISQR